MYQSESLFLTGVGDSVKMSPVLLAALSCANMTADHLVDRMLEGDRQLVTGPGLVLDASVVAATPAGSSVYGRGCSIDLSTPRPPRALAFDYYEADQVPILTLYDVSIPETIAVALPGMRFTSVVAGTFEALRRADPIIETVTISSDEDRTVVFILAMDWIAVPLKPERHHRRGYI